MLNTRASRPAGAGRATVRGAAAGFLVFAAAASAPAETPLSKPGAATTPAPGAVSSFSGAGATFPYPAYARWADAYRKETGVSLNYQSIGSGGGIRQILARAVTFGASDMFLSAARLDKEGLAQFPTLLGAVVAVVNLDGVGPGELTLDGPTVARIFLGDITKWNHPAITRLNASLNLPPADIIPIHRADGSGTTFVWTDYLGKVSPDWNSRVGSAAGVEWPVGVGVKGGGTAETLRHTRGGIAYIEYAYAKQDRLAHVRLVNKYGQAVAPDRKTIQAAAASAGWTSASGFGLTLTDQHGLDSWPVVGTTYVLMPKQAPAAAESAAALAFFNWGYDKGSPLAEELDYVPLPPGVVKMIKRSWREITADGKPVFAAD